jgi:hypothetical protein
MAVRGSPARERLRLYVVCWVLLLLVVAHGTRPQAKQAVPFPAEASIR